jgi:hypothetical protein
MEVREQIVHNNSLQFSIIPMVIIICILITVYKYVDVDLTYVDLTYNACGISVGSFIGNRINIPS